MQPSIKISLFRAIAARTSEACRASRLDPARRAVWTRSGVQIRIAARASHSSNADHSTLLTCLLSEAEVNFRAILTSSVNEAKRLDLLDSFRRTWSAGFWMSAAFASAPNSRPMEPPKYPSSPRKRKLIRAAPLVYEFGTRRDGGSCDKIRSPRTTTPTKHRQWTCTFCSGEDPGTRHLVRQSTPRDPYTAS